MMNVIKCECGKEFSASKLLDRRGDSVVFEIGITCPCCGKFTRSYYDSDELSRLGS